MDYAEAIMALDDGLASLVSRAESNGLTLPEIVAEIKRELDSYESE